MEELRGARGGRGGDVEELRVARGGRGERCGRAERS